MFRTNKFEHFRFAFKTLPTNDYHRQTNRKRIPINEPKKGTKLVRNDFLSHRLCVLFFRKKNERVSKNFVVKKTTTSIDQTSMKKHDYCEVLYSDFNNKLLVSIMKIGFFIVRVRGKFQLSRNYLIFSLLKIATLKEGLLLKYISVSV